MAGLFVGLGSWAWIVLGLLLMGAELLAPGIYLLWIGVAAIVTGAVDSMLGLSWQASTLLFALLCIASVIGARQMIGGRTRNETDAPFLNRRADELVGKVFTLEEPIVAGQGRVHVGDSVWRVTGDDRLAGAKVKVVRVDGATLVVEGA